MRIAFINTYGNGSTGKIVDSLKKILEDNNIECVSYFSREYCATPETSKRFFSKTGFYFDALMTRIFDNHGLNSKMNTKKIIKNLKQFNPDIIHIHNLHGYWINYEMLFKYIKKYGIKVVFTLHDCWSFTGHCTHFDYIGCEKWKRGCYSCPQLHEYPKSFIFDGSTRNYKKKRNAFLSLDSNQMKIVTPSIWLHDKVKESYLNKYECIVINNGVDTTVFKPTPSNLREKYGIGNKIIVLAVASYWDEKKGLAYFFDSARIKKDWIFVYIGKNKNSLNSNYENVIHIDRTESQEELTMWYSTANIYMNPTLEDTYPTTNLEAISCGTPVVTFVTGGSPEIVNKTNFGLAVEKGNLNQLIEAMESIVLSPKFYNEKLISESICIENFGKKYLSLYTELGKKCFEK